jgi:hypothetical protein
VTAASRDSPIRTAEGIVNLLGLLGDMCMVGAAESVRGVGCQAVVAAPVTWFQVVNRSVIAWRCSWAESRCRPGRKCGEMPLKADKNRWACRAEGELQEFTGFGGEVPVAADEPFSLVHQST